MKCMRQPLQVQSGPCLRHGIFSGHMGRYQRALTWTHPPGGLHPLLGGLLELRLHTPQLGSHGAALASSSATGCAHASALLKPPSYLDCCLPGTSGCHQHFSTQQISNAYNRATLLAWRQSLLQHPRGSSCSPAKEFQGISSVSQRQRRWQGHRGGHNAHERH